MPGGLPELLEGESAPLPPADQKEEIRQTRATTLQVLKGERPIPMTLVGPVQVAEPLRAVEELPLSEEPKLPISPAVKADS